MYLENFIKENPEINVTIKGIELIDFGNTIADRAVKKYIDQHDEKAYTRQDVINKFQVCSATLWRWEKMGLLKGKKIGRRLFYPESEIKRVMNLKNNEK
jgi:hypothetical protein